MESLIKSRIRRLCSRCLTMLGVGPMSLNCVNAAVDLSNRFAVPLFLIASRRQVDSLEFGGGYANNWDTQTFSDYVLQKDKRDCIILSRDHGGPWQSPHEVTNGLGLRHALESAKRSYCADIRAGFQLLHIDPSIDIHFQPSTDDILARIYELYDYCWSESQRLNKSIAFEIGTEEQSGSIYNSLDEFEYVISSVNSFCHKNKFDTPTFVVAQTGTRVLETRNVGSFDSLVRVKYELPAEIQVPKIVKICENNNVLLKEHNADYLSDSSLRWHPLLGIHAANVAPQFGICESQALASILSSNGLKALRDQFLEIAFKSNKWVKWLLPNTSSTDYDKAILAGHYVFSSPDFIELRSRIIPELLAKDIDMDTYLQSQIEDSIKRYMLHFRLISL